MNLHDARIADPILHAKSIAHRAGHDLQLHLVLRRERDQHDEERHQEAHQIGEGHEPAVPAMACFLAPRHRLDPSSRAELGRRGLRFLVAMLLAWRHSQNPAA